MVFSLDIEGNPAVEKEINRFLSPGFKDYLEASYRRSFMYRDHIMARLREKGAPPEIYFLPVIESEYRTNPVSRAGAVGLWQFMYNSIGREMYINEWMDDRRDFWKATDAAIDLLMYNYSTFGDWLLSLAAYNCGPSKLRQVIRAGNSRNFWDLADIDEMPNETAHYIPRFLAVAYILSYPGRHGIGIEWREPLEWERVPVTHPVDIRILAREAGVPYELLDAGNRELYYKITPPRHVPYSLKVPAEYTDQIKRTLQTNEMRLVRYYIYSIRQGDTIYALARHYGVSESMILSYNPGVRPRSIQIGTRLIIPALKEVGPYVAPKPQPAASAAPDDSRPHAGQYIVRNGDTLWDIARRFDTSVDRISRENSIARGTHIQPGQVLKVPVKEAVSRRSENRHYSGQYVVQDGDTLWDISRRFNTSVEQLSRENRLARGNYIRPGQVLKVPMQTEGRVQ
jgi:membrane-bound lytic murein transglycosylase D